MRGSVHCFYVSVLAIVLPAAAQAAVIATSFGVGADAEVRDHQPATNFGASTELATRILDNSPPGASDVTARFSAKYLKFDLAGASLSANGDVFVRLTLRNSILLPTGFKIPAPRTRIFGRD